MEVTGHFLVISGLKTASFSANKKINDWKGDNLKEGSVANLSCRYWSCRVSCCPVAFHYDPNDSFTMFKYFFQNALYRYHN